MKKIIRLNSLIALLALSSSISLYASEDEGLTPETVYSSDMIDWTFSHLGGTVDWEAISGGNTWFDPLPAKVKEDTGCDDGIGVEYDDDNDTDAWAVSPAVELEGEQLYTITVWAAAASNGDPENFKLVMGTAAAAAELAESGTTLVERTGFSSYTFTKFTASVTPDETGEYYFGLNCFSEAENYGMYATGFKVDKMVDIETGVTSVAVDAAATVLYDLRGNVVSGKPARGVYVKVSGGKATKVIY